MELGDRLKQARLDAGLSQRQLCGDMITRNMLSQIENGAARPSLDTLRYLAERLGKSMSFFLEEDAVRSPNQERMKQARSFFAEKKWEQLRDTLKDYQEPDEVFGQEKRLLERLMLLSLAQQAISDGRGRYAGELLQDFDIADEDYCAADLKRRYLLLLAKTDPQQRQEVCKALPKLDEELLLRARDALDRGSFSRSGALLDAAEDRVDPEWNFLRGEVYLAQERFEEAAACYHKAENRWPEKTAARLERCYRELEDYKKAYFYACKQR